MSLNVTEECMKSYNWLIDIINEMQKSAKLR